jgi:signal transduction histidine kinase
VQVRLAVGAEDARGRTRVGAVLTVQDDGRGFTGALGPSSDTDADPAVFGVGLVGMLERMRELGGHLDVRPTTPRGTVVEAWVPLRAGHGDEEDAPPSAHQPIADHA